MKAKIFLVIALTLLLSSAFSAKTYAQDQMDFEEFMGMLSQTFTEDQLDELSYQLPDSITVCGYSYGDFSGEGYNDFIISVKEKGVTPPNTVDVYVLKSIADTTYMVVSEKNYKYYELTLEVAFLVKDGLCFVTNRDSGTWYFTSYKINDDLKFEQQDRESYPIEFEKAGN